tara:strand:+ start:178 stop:2415 length:2238 start_codon:yes stop_codon:yes gene_type:complete
MTIQYDPQKVTDWLTPLEKVYNRQSTQLDRYQSQLRERDRQEEAATLNLPAIFGKLASFSQSIASAKAASERKENEKKIKEFARIEYERAEAEVNPENIKLALERLTDAENLKKNKVEYEELVKKIAKENNFSQNDITYLVSLHGGKLLAEREFQGHQLATFIGPEFQEYLNGTTEQSKEAQLRWESNKNNPHARKQQLQEFAIDKFDELNFKKEFVLDNYWKSINRNLDTNETLSKIKVAKTLLTQRSLEIDGEIDVAKGQLINNESALTFQAQLHIKEGVDPSRGITVEDSKENYTVRLERLAITGKFTEEELRLLKTGQLPIPHAAGKTGEILLKPEQWKRIQNSINAYNEGQVNLRNESIKVGATNTIAALYKGDLSIEEAQQIKNDALLTIRNTLGEQSEAYKKLDAVDPTDQIEGSYEIAKAKYTEIFNGNDISKVLQIEKDIDLESNGRVKAELQAIVEETKAVLRAANLPDTWSGYLETIKGDMIADSGLDKTLDPDRAFTRNQERVQLFVAKKKLNTLLAASRAGESVDTAEGIHQEWLEKNGWGDATGAGMLSPNAEGVFERFEFLQDAKIQNTTKPSDYQMNRWKGRIQKALDKANGNIEEMLNTAESYIDKEDALGAFIEPSQTDEFQLFYSPELITKSLAIGKQPGYVLKKSIEALIANPDYKDYVNKFKLKEKLESLEDAPDLKLKDIIDKLGDRDFITQYNYRGIMSFTPKQLTRLMNLEIASNVPIVEK